jgi:hypothetical protein
MENRWGCRKIIDFVGDSIGFRRKRIQAACERRTVLGRLYHDVCFKLQWAMTGRFRDSGVVRQNEASDARGTEK